MALLSPELFAGGVERDFASGATILIFAAQEVTAKLVFVHRAHG